MDGKEKWPKGQADVRHNLCEIRADLKPTIKLIAICHEAGHLIDYHEDELEYFRVSALKNEARAWINGLPLAIEMGILERYINWWIPYSVKEGRFEEAQE